MKLQLLIVLIVFLAIIKPVIADQVNADNSTVRTLDKSDNRTEMKFPGSGSTKKTTTITEPPEDTSDTTKPYGKNLVPEGSTVKCSFTGEGGNELITWIDPCGYELTTSSLNGPVTFYDPCDLNTYNPDSQTPIENPGGSTTTLNVNGSIITKNADGSITTIMSNSSVTTKKPDGSTITRNPDGSVTAKDAKGSTLQFGTVPTTKNADGSTTTVNSDGSTITQNPDGSAVVKDAKGSTLEFATFGVMEKIDHSITTVNPDDTIITVNDDGSTIIRNPDNSITAKDANGSTLRFDDSTHEDIATKIYPGGSQITKYSSGSKLTRNADDSIVVKFAGNSKTIYAPPLMPNHIMNDDGSITLKYPDHSMSTLNTNGTIISVGNYDGPTEGPTSTDCSVLRDGDGGYWLIGQDSDGWNIGTHYDQNGNKIGRFESNGKEIWIKDEKGKIKYNKCDECKPYKPPNTKGKKSPDTKGKKSPDTKDKKSPDTKDKKPTDTKDKTSPDTKDKKSPDTKSKNYMDDFPVKGSSFGASEDT